MLAVVFLLLVTPAAGATTVTLLHFSDYHSHARPFESQDGPDRGGLARAIGYLAREKRHGALVFSGGDMMNKGAPAWSDRYRCEEWRWLNGIVDAMAFGNHDADYGYAEFARCRDGAGFPILSANTAGFPRSVVLESKGIRIGVFAVAGADFPTLVQIPELRFGDAVAAAREVVRELREEERVQAVVLIGHQHWDADFALARAVPGIDVIFGTHSHLRQELTQVPGTGTWFISSFQYLTWISRVELTFHRNRLTGVSGRLVPVDRGMSENGAVARRVAAMQRALENDPQYRHLFAPFATLPAAISVDDLGRLTVEIMRTVAGAGLALSTSSSFRGPLPPGPIDLETLRGALPYDNEIVVVELPAGRARALLEFVRGQTGDAAAFASGEIGGDPVSVAATDYMVNAAAGYRDFFAGQSVRRTGVRVREEVRKHLARGAAEAVP